MSTKTTKFQGSKFRYQTGKEAQKNITAITLNNTNTPAELTIASSGYAKGDMIQISGCGNLDGIYPILSVESNKVKLSEEVDWKRQDLPTSYTNAKAERITFSAQFCAIKNIEKSEDSLSTEDVTTVCSEGTETEPGEIEYGSIKLNFFLLGEHNAEKQLASFCGKALNDWKGKKPLLEATLKIFEDKMQIDLPILTK